MHFLPVASELFYLTWLSHMKSIFIFPEKQCQNLAAQIIMSLNAAFAKPTLTSKVKLMLSWNSFLYSIHIEYAYKQVLVIGGFTWTVIPFLLLGNRPSAWPQLKHCFCKWYWFALYSWKPTVVKLQVKHEKCRQLTLTQESYCDKINITNLINWSYIAKNAIAHQYYVNKTTLHKWTTK